MMIIPKTHQTPNQTTPRKEDETPPTMMTRPKHRTTPHHRGQRVHQPLGGEEGVHADTGSYTH